jgi:hypothetical protein
VNTEQNIAARVETLLQQMTLAEKIGQMNQYSDFWEVTGPNSQAGDAEMKLEHLAQGRVGSMQCAGCGTYLPTTKAGGGRVAAGHTAYFWF